MRIATYNVNGINGRLANLLGWLWTAFGPAAAFMALALFAGLVLIGIFLRASPEMRPGTPIP